MMDKKCSCTSSCKGWALLALRIAVGGIFIFHGWGKLFGNAPGMTAFTGMVGMLGFPAPVLFAYAAALSEFFGGIAVLLGVFTRAAATLIGIVMLVALVLVKKFSFPAADVDLSLLATAVALALMGAGAYSVEGMMKKDRPGPETVSGKT